MVRLSGPESRAISETILQFSQTHSTWRTWGAMPWPLGRYPDQVVVTLLRSRPAPTLRKMWSKIACHEIAGRSALLCGARRRRLRKKLGGALAGPGEFTLRAYLNGRLDLPRAEAVRDLIEIDYRFTRRASPRSRPGSVKPAASLRWKEALLGVDRAARSRPRLRRGRHQRGARCRGSCIPPGAGAAWSERARRQLRIRQAGPFPE